MIVVQIIERIQVILCRLHADEDFFVGIFLVLVFGHLEEAVKYASETLNFVDFRLARQFIFPLMHPGSSIIAYSDLLIAAFRMSWMYYRFIVLVLIDSVKISDG